MKGDRLVGRSRIRLRVRRKVRGTREVPRCSVFRSLRAIYAQVIDDAKGQTLAAVSSRDIEAKAFDVELARKAGVELARRCQEKGIGAVAFDRGGYRFHGKVKALADGAREGGLKF